MSVNYKSITTAVLICSSLFLGNPTWSKLLDRTEKPIQDDLDWSWLDRDLTGDSGPFVTIQNALDNEVARGQLNTREIDQYEAAYRRDKLNPLLGF